MQVQLWRTVLKRVFGKYMIFRNDQLKIVNEQEWEYYLSADSNESGNTGKKKIMRLDPETVNFSVDLVDF